MGIMAQTTAFEEDFESSPVNSVKNDFGDTLWTGESWCEQAARGMTSHHNSTNVDFKNGQNSGYFLANNPEDSCGGFNIATVVSDSFDFSGYDSLRFSCRYFMSDAIGWGPTTLQVQFMTSSNSFTIDTVFNDTSDWANIDIRLPSSMLDDTTWFTMDLGGGEAVGVDDLLVYEPSSTSFLARKKKGEKLRVHPNPFRDKLQVRNSFEESEELRLRILDLTGRTVQARELRAKEEFSISLPELREGVYFLELSNGKGQKRVQRIVKE